MCAQANRQPRLGWVSATLAAVLCSELSVWAGQPAAGGEQGSPVSETRVFDIRSLLLEVPDYRAVFSDLRSDDIFGPVKPPPADAGILSDADGKAMRSSESQAEGQQENAEVLMRMLQEIVVPESWRDYGGDVGVMHYYGGQLVVSNTPDVIVETERLLNLLKASRSLKLRLDACFVTVPSQAGPTEMGGLGKQNEFAPDEFRKLLATHADELSVTRASVSGFEGQRIFTTAGRQYNVLVGTDAVVASGSAAYTPVARQLVSGVTLEVQAVLDAARETVLVDLRTSLGELRPTSPPASVPTDPLAVGSSVPPYQVAHFATSVSLPVGRYSLVGIAHYDDDRDVMLFVMPSRE
ncbi:MAG TPA: hypothetical protein VM243_04505 [Phycisphaerae bacterium]|nr:hypothetical protein [Phycisphaerae bacterium]